MHHHFIDNYSDLDSPLHQLPAVTKFIATFIIIAIISLVPRFSWLLLEIFVLIVTTLMLLSHTPVMHHIKRLAAILPFVALISFSALFSADGWNLFGNIIIRSSLSILMISILFATTTFPELLKAFGSMGMPKLMIHLFTFMYRYVYIFEDQFHKMQQAALSRNFSIKNLLHWNTLSNISGSLLIHSYERSEIIYQAMKARGYQEYESH
ncbi:MAG: energy-coupling factor transporter transmembrane component T [bacterium]